MARAGKHRRRRGSKPVRTASPVPRTTTAAHPAAPAAGAGDPTPGTGATTHGQPSPARERTPAQYVVTVPFKLALLAIVIGLAAVLVAVSIFPIFAGLASAINGLRQKLAEAETAYKEITFPETSRIYTADGKLLTTVDSGENRKLVRLEKVAPVAREAVIAIEDDQFYNHGPLDAQAIIRAAFTNIGAGEITQGGSTITQQLVKNGILGSNEQTFQRKFQEAALAIRMERELSKDEILELYLNQVYFANGVYGIGTAADYYFGKPASELSLPQAALLAGVIRYPYKYDPVRFPKVARERRNVVIDRMLELGKITEKEAEKARKAPIKLKIERDRDRTKPFIVQYAIEELVDPANKEFEDILGETREQRERNLGRRGLEITTTFYPRWIEEAAQAATQDLGLRGGRQAAIATVEVGDGAVRMVMSGQNYEREERNLVVAREVGGVYQGVRQPGSAFKPMTLVAAFRENIPPETTFSSTSPFRSQKWDNACHCVYNAEGAGAGGMMTLWDATKYSTNVVFAQLALKVGPDKIVKAAKDMGITTPMAAVPSITLGSEETSPLDMASAYATLANDGTYCEPYVIAKIRDSRGRVIYDHRHDGPKCKEEIDPDITRTITRMLEGVVDGGTGTGANISGEDVAGKTGTSQDSADLWFVGYTPELSTAVWVGYPRGRVPMEGEYGGTVAAPIWHDYMVRVLRDVKDRSGFKDPDDRIKSGTEVPDVIGMKKDDAVDLLEKKLFTAEVQEVDSDEKKGVVIAQSPRGGSKADTGSTVVIEVSTGTPAEVPSVVGLIEYEAKRQLEQAGYDVSVVDVTVSKKSQNRIVQSQTPRGGSEAKDGTTVTIEVGNYEK